MGLSIAADLWCSDVKGRTEEHSATRIRLRVTMGEKTRDKEEKLVLMWERDPWPDIPHPWPYLKEAFGSVGSQNSSWLLLSMFIIFQSIYLTWSWNGWTLIVFKLIIQRRIGSSTFTKVLSIHYIYSSKSKKKKRRSTATKMYSKVKSPYFSISVGNMLHRCDCSHRCCNTCRVQRCLHH